ncbi:MAG: hypothetical protein R3C61_01535 [Bacteroidia bacterium]
MRKKSAPAMRPQDIGVLLKICLEESDSWTQISLARALCLSQSEISESITRSTYARLLFDKGRQVHRLAFMDFIQYGLAFVFPQQPGMVQRGIPTAHSAPPLSTEIISEEKYVWPFAKGNVRGHSILPLYPAVVQAVQADSQLYELLALIDAVRVGRARERNLALDMLKKKLL